MTLRGKLTLPESEEVRIIPRIAYFTSAQRREYRDAARDHALREFIKVVEKWMEGMPIPTSLTDEEVKEVYTEWLRDWVRIRREALDEQG